MATRYLAGAALAAAATYFFDPVSGRRRRARLREKAVHYSNELSEAAGTATRDLAHRGRGLIAKARVVVQRDDGTDDDTLAERIRSAIGRVVSHPGAIEVQVLGSRAIVSGAVLAREHEALMAKVRAVRGVQDAEDYLTVYQSSDGVPELQGGTPRQAGGLLRQENWPPGIRLLGGALGALLLLAGIRSRSFKGLLGVTAGTAILTRTVANRPLREIGGSPRHGRIQIAKAIRVNAPIEEVFRTLADYTNFPQFMRNVREVTQGEDGRSRWVVAGPAGIPVEWQSVTTRYEPNRVIAWCTVPGSTVDSAGVIHFEPGNGGTNLRVRMSYSPPAGALGHVVAQLFGKDPKSEMDEDLVRLKSYLETGQRPRDAAVKEREPEREPERDRPH